MTSQSPSRSYITLVKPSCHLGQRTLLPVCSSRTPTVTRLHLFPSHPKAHGRFSLCPPFHPVFSSAAQLSLGDFAYRWDPPLMGASAKVPAVPWRSEECSWSHPCPRLHPCSCGEMVLTMTSNLLSCSSHRRGQEQLSGPLMLPGSVRRPILCLPRSTVGSQLK